MRFIPQKVKMMFTLGQMAQCVPKTVISTALHILWQNILDTQENVSYATASKKEVLIKKHFCLPLPTLTCVIENENE